MKQGREIGLERFEAIIAQMREKMARTNATTKQKAIVDDLDQVRVLYSILLDDNVSLRAIVIDFYEAHQKPLAYDDWVKYKKPQSPEVRRKIGIAEWNKECEQYNKIEKIYSRLEDNYNQELKQIQWHKNQKSKTKS